MSTTTVLFLAANPRDMQQLSLDEESRTIDHAIQQAGHSQQFEFRPHTALRITDLPPLLLRYRPPIVHFSGHGSMHGEIILQDADGFSITVPPDALTNLFRVFSKFIRCVILDACYSEAQATAIANHIDCVVGTTDEITDIAAIQFSSGFYGALAAGEDVSTAFELGCIQIGLHGLDEAYIPQLLGDGRDVRFVAPQQVVPPQQEGDVEKASSGREGGINFTNSTADISGDVSGRDKNVYFGTDN